MVQTLWKIVWRFLKKLKIEKLYNPAISNLGFIQKNTNSVRYIHPDIHCSIISNSQDMKITGVSISGSIDEWIKKLWLWLVWLSV